MNTDNLKYGLSMITYLSTWNPKFTSKRNFTFQIPTNATKRTVVAWR